MVSQIRMERHGSWRIIGVGLRGGERDWVDHDIFALIGCPAFYGVSGAGANGEESGLA